MNIRIDTSSIPPNTRFPSSSSSPATHGNGPRATTGRPGLWSSSTQRKISRLYVYTTLPLKKIVQVVHRSPDNAQPKVDSAHKHLNALLDKEPRWLHPKDDSDMSRRLAELSRSPSRSSAASRASSQRPHAASDPGLYLYANVHLQNESGISPTLEVPPFHRYPTADRASMPLSSRDDTPSTFSSVSPPPRRSSMAGQDDTQDFSSFLRQSTFMSGSTDYSTGSFHRVLNGFPEPYIQVVKKLVKRFTAPINPRPDSMSAIPEDATTCPTWLNDGDAPNPLRSRPHFLPGDYLCFDLLLRQHACSPGTYEHAIRACLCHVRSELCYSPWLTEENLTPAGHELQRMGQGNIRALDAFGNTVLHFMAARVDHYHLYQMILEGYCDTILGSTNTAGQTLLHVLRPSWYSTPGELSTLLQLLRSKRFNVHAQDHYGRNFFHMMMANGANVEIINHLLQGYDPNHYNKRDAFGMLPQPYTQPNMFMERRDNSPQQMDIDQTSTSPSYHGYRSPDDAEIYREESHLIKHTREAKEKPKIEDNQGRNGLHCLAAATLSQEAVLQKYGMIRRRKEDAKNPDASTEKLEYRLLLLENLLAAGVDPNHYDSNGNTPLMAFVANFHEEDDYKVGPKILEALIKGGANVHARNRAGETALHVAVRCGRKLAVRTLQENEANVHVRDAAGRSLLGLADVKIQGTREDDARGYAHFEACRAWLSGKGLAVQEPSTLQEWGVRRL